MTEEIIYRYSKEYSKEFICFHDPTGNFISASSSVTRVTGWLPNDLIGNNLYDYISDEDKDFFEMVVHLPIINGSHENLNADIRFKVKSGNYTWMNIDIIPEKDEKGIITNLITVSRDVSDFMRMKEKYEKKQALLTNTGQMAQLGAWEYDVLAKIITWSKETYDIFDVQESYKPDLEFIYSFFQGESSDLITKSFSNGIEHGIPFDLTIPFVTAKAKNIWVRVMATPKIHLGKVVKLYGVIQNIDKEVNANLILKSMVKQLTKQNRQLEDFTHILSHNVRGPIASLTTLLTMLETAETDDERKEIMDMLKMSSNSLENLLNELKEVINATHVRGIESQENNLQQIINYSIELLRGEIKQTNASINLDLSGWEIINYPKIYLESIIMNLMSNALKYRADNREPILTIRTILENGLFILKFSDNGSGIDLAKHGENVFKLYKTFHVSKPGKGLGLFMTKSQIEAMGGEITIESEKNVGTTFIIVFNKEKVTDISQQNLENITSSK